MATQRAQKTTKDEKELTPQQLLFVAEYVKRGCKDATGAAIAAGYSEKTAASQASRLLKNAKVQELVDVRLRAAADLAEASAADVLRELKKVGFSDPSDMFDDNGRLLPLKQMPERIRKAIASIDVEAQYEGFGEDRRWVGDLVKVKFWPKVSALDLLGKNLKLWTEVIDAKVSSTIQLVDPYAEPKEGK